MWSRKCIIFRLKELQFSEIKIDGSFVKGCAVDKGNANVCASIIKLAHAFGSKASAVGIESSEDAQALLGLGCDIGQGYLFAKPMTQNELMDRVMAARAEKSGGVLQVLSRRLEDRKSPRRHTRRAATVSLGPGRMSVPCIIWDISDGGARLAIGHSLANLPRHFTLNFSETAASGAIAKLCGLMRGTLV